jgi:hypothetical protein
MPERDMRKDGEMHGKQTFVQTIVDVWRWLHPLFQSGAPSFSIGCTQLRNWVRAIF